MYELKSVHEYLIFNVSNFLKALKTFQSRRARKSVVDSLSGHRRQNPSVQQNSFSI